MNLDDVQYSDSHHCFHDGYVRSGHGRTRAAALEDFIEQNNITPDPNKPGLKAGILFRWGSLWVGAHYNPYNKRWCINPVPCVTIWITLPGGKTP